MNEIPSEMRIFTGNANRPLAEKIVQYIGIRLGESYVGRFADGEINVRIAETVRGYDVYVIQSLSKPVNDNVMELLIMIDALKRASAKSVTAVIPYFAYARQDRKAKGRDPISAKLLANLITVAGADRVVTVELHADQIQGFFDIPVDNLWSATTFAKHLKNLGFCKDDVVVVSPDVGGVKRARVFAEKINVPLAILDKRRPKDNVAEIVNVIGDVKGKKALIFDDIIDTGGSLIGAVNTLLEHGAVEVYACATHGVLSDDAIEKIQKSKLKKVFITDTIHHENLPDKFEIVSIAPLLGEAIIRIRKNLSVSILFR